MQNVQGPQKEGDMYKDPKRKVTDTPIRFRTGDPRW